MNEQAQEAESQSYTLQQKVVKDLYFLCETNLKIRKLDSLWHVM